MKYIKKFNDSSIEDNLYVFFDVDPSLKDETEDLHFFVFDKNKVENVKNDEFKLPELDRYLRSIRFKNFDCWCDISTNSILVLLATKIFVSEHQNLLFKNLKEEDHPLKTTLHPDSFDPFFHSENQILYDLYKDAKIYRGLPDGCSLVKGLNNRKSYEFWNQKTMNDPISVSSQTKLQYIMFKLGI